PPAGGGMFWQGPVLEGGGGLFCSAWGLGLAHRRERCRAGRDHKGGRPMKCMAAALMLATLASLPASADTAVPQFQVDPLWPKPLPNNCILGQAAGSATDPFGRT